MNRKLAFDFLRDAYRGHGLRQSNAAVCDPHVGDRAGCCTNRSNEIGRDGVLSHPGVENFHT